MILGIVDYNWYLILVSDKQWVRYSKAFPPDFILASMSSFIALIKIRDYLHCR